MDDDLLKAAMQILVDAGNGRNETYRCVRAIEAGDFETASTHLENAEQELRKAHSLHTNCIQKEAAGESSGSSMIFSHAQDTLMTAYSEYRLVNRLTPVLKRFDERLTALEAR